MSNFVYDNEAIVAGKDNLSLRPTVPANKKIVAAEWNTLAAAMTDLSNATKAGVFHGLVGGASPAVAPTGETRLKSGVAGLEVSFSGGAYAPITGGSGDTVSITAFGSTPSDGGATNVAGAITMQPCDGTHPGAVSEADQVMGAGVKTFPSAVGMVSAPSAAVSGAGEVRFRSNAGSPEVSANGGAYTTLATGTGTLDTPQEVFSVTNHVSLSLAAHCNYYHTTTQDTTLDAPTNALGGMSGCVEFIQGATPRLITWAAFWRFSGGIEPALTPTVGARDYLFFYIPNGATYAVCRLVGNAL